jgi:hypothetical protein
MDTLLDRQTLMVSHHDRGTYELVHRVLKDFAAPALPFTKFARNAGFYYAMLLAFNFYEAFKEDGCAPTIPTSSEPDQLQTQDHRCRSQAGSSCW